MDKEIGQEFEKLASMVAGGFSSLEKKMGERFDAVGERLSVLEKRTGVLEGRVSNLDDQVTYLADSIRSLCTESEELPDKIDTTYAKTLNSLEDRVGALENTTT